VNQWVDFRYQYNCFCAAVFYYFGRLFFKRWPGQEQRASKAVVDQLINDHVETF
jgi:hypothetical protein